MRDVGTPNDDVPDVAFFNHFLASSIAYRFRIRASPLAHDLRIRLGVDRIPSDGAGGAVSMRAPPRTPILLSEVMPNNEAARQYADDVRRFELIRPLVDRAATGIAHAIGLVEIEHVVGDGQQGLSPRPVARLCRLVGVAVRGTGLRLFGRGRRNIFAHVRASSASRALAARPRDIPVASTSRATATASSRAFAP